MADLDGQLLDHRPHRQHGTPLEVLCKAFAKYPTLMLSEEPLPADCKAVYAMMEAASQVVSVLQAL